MFSKIQLAEYIKSEYNFDLITQKKIINKLLSSDSKIIIDTICEYKLFDFLYLYNIDFMDFYNNCDKDIINKILYTNIDDFNIELLFFYLKDNNYIFDSNLIKKITDKKHKNSIYFTIVNPFEEKETNLNIQKTYEEYLKLYNNKKDKIDKIKK